jgi:hypothetical protein
MGVRIVHIYVRIIRKVYFPPQHSLVHTYISTYNTRSFGRRRRSFVIRSRDPRFDDSEWSSYLSQNHRRGVVVFSTLGAIASTVEDDRAMQPRSTTTTSSSFFGLEKESSFCNNTPLKPIQTDNPIRTIASLPWHKHRRSPIIPHPSIVS